MFRYKIKKSLLLAGLISMSLISACTKSPEKQAESTEAPSSIAADESMETETGHETADSVESSSETEKAAESAAQETEKFPETELNEDIPEQSELFTMDDYTSPETGKIKNKDALYSDEFVTIKALDIESDSTDTMLTLVIKNNSDTDINLACTYSSVNDFVINTGFSEDIAAGSEVTTGIAFENALLNANNTKTISDIEAAFTVYNLEENYAVLAETGTLTIETDAEPDNAEAEAVSGDLLYSYDNIQIIYKGILENDEGAMLAAFLVINKSGSNIALSTVDDTVNVDGTDHIVVFDEDIPSGKSSTCVLTLYDPELAETITFEENLQIRFLISDSDTWDTIDTTDVLNIPYE